MSALPMPAILERHYLQPGQLFVSAKPVAITTILGSCVAVCLWDPHRPVGGMNHFMLPMATGSATASPRFGVFAMEQLIAELAKAGARVPLLRARVYGGACMFGSMNKAEHLGHKNSDLALEFLARRGVDIVAVDVGGTRGRKLIFHTDGGATWTTLI